MTCTGNSGLEGTTGLPPRGPGCRGRGADVRVRRRLGAAWSVGPAAPQCRLPPEVTSLLWQPGPSQPPAPRSAGPADAIAAGASETRSSPVAVLGWERASA